MRAKAFILFCCLLVYVLELVAIPVLYLPASLQQGDRPVNPPGCSKLPVKRCGAGEENSGCETTGCQNCPLGYVMVAAQVVTPPQPSTTSERLYSTAQMEYRFLYLSEAWKPPDVFGIAMNNKQLLTTSSLNTSSFNTTI